MVKLEEFATPVFLQGIFSLYEHVKKNCKNARDVLKQFQMEMRGIKDWSPEVLENELKRFRLASVTVDKLIEGIFKICFMTHGVRETKYPRAETYLHECYLCIARQLFKNPFLVYDVGISSREKRQNIMEVESIIRKSVRNTFMHMLPFAPLDLYEEDANSDDVDDPVDTTDNHPTSDDEVEDDVQDDMQDVADDEVEDDGEADGVEEEHQVDGAVEDITEGAVEAEEASEEGEDEEAKNDEVDLDHASEHDDEKVEDDAGDFSSSEDEEENEEEEEDHDEPEVVVMPQHVKVVNIEEPHKKTQRLKVHQNVLKRKDIIKAKLLQHVQAAAAPKTPQDSFF